MDENKIGEKPGFSPRPGELACALLMYPAAYIYIVCFGSRNDPPAWLSAGAGSGLTA